jgi:hypothetical protein
MGFLKGKPEKSTESANATSQNISNNYSDTSGSSYGMSQSGNRNLGRINSIYGSQASQGQRASDQMGNLMGLNGPQGSQAAADGYRNFQNSTGYQNIYDEAMRGVTGSSGAKGLLGSGSRLKAMQDRGSGMAQQSFGNYLGNLNQLSANGMQAGGLMSGAGQYSDSRNMSTNRSVAQKTGAQSGLGGLIGQVAGSAVKIFSDRRLKQDIVKVGELANGLGVYDFKYKSSPDTIYRGVMADEVATVQPLALGPVIDGFATVDYGQIDMEGLNHGVS